MTTVQLTDQDALAFIKFQKHYSLVQTLESLGVFDMKNGHCEIHFDHLGQISLLTVVNNYRPNKYPIDGDK